LLEMRVAAQRDLAGALATWRSANTARGLPPSIERISRVAEKLSSPEAVVVVGCEDEKVLGMALAEPFRDRDGSGPVVPFAGHISMVFVLPERWGAGIGGQLLDQLHRQMRERGWSRTSVWTRSSNSRARALYAGRGYELTAETKHLENGDQIVQYQTDLTRPTTGG
jgi:ribosomal protein S18 acetylase RimI-like enzyme